VKLLKPPKRLKSKVFFNPYVAMSNDVIPRVNTFRNKVLSVGKV